MEGKPYQMFYRKIITQNTLQEHLAEATVSLLSIARDLAWNTISDNCLYIISNLKNRKKNLACEESLKKPGTKSWRRNT